MGAKKIKKERPLINIFNDQWESKCECTNTHTRYCTWSLPFATEVLKYYIPGLYTQNFSYNMKFLLFQTNAIPSTLNH